MKKPDEESVELRLSPRAKQPVTLELPNDVLESLRQVASNRDMTVDALLKFYVGLGLRQDLSRQFGDRVLETTADVLSRHIPSEEEVSSILREIRNQAVGTE